MLLFDNLCEPSDTVELFEYRLAFSGTIHHLAAAGVGV
jgi:hypothetical protein